MEICLIDILRTIIKRSDYINAVVCAYKRTEMEDAILALHSYIN